MTKKLLFVLVVFSWLIPCISCMSTEPEPNLKIGCVLSLTGSLGPKGENRLDACRLAVEEINADGGVLGKQIELIEADDATDADKCLEQVKEMVSKQGIKVLIGGMSSAAVMTTGPYLAEQKIVMVSPSATATEISDQAWTSWFFRTTPRDAFQSWLLAEIITDEGFTRLATMVQSSSYGTGLENSIVEALEKTGWTGEHVASMHFDLNKKDYSTQLQIIQNSNPDVVLAVTYVEDGSIIFKQALDMGLDKIAWLGCDGNYGDAMFADPKCAEFMEKAIIAGTRSTPSSGDAYNNFAVAYKTTTGKDPDIYCDTTYDAVNIIAKAIEKAGSYDSAAIRETLFEIGQKYPGASGNITFDSNGDRVSGTYEIWKVEKDPTTKTGYKNVRIKVISIG